MKKLLIALLVLVSVSAGAQVKETIVRMDSASSLFKEKYYPKQLIRISTDSTLLALTHATQIGQSMQTVLDSLWYKVIGTPSSVSDSTFAYAVTELTINGVTQNLKHDRTWTIASTDSGSFQKSDSNTVRNAITLTYLNSRLALKRNLNNHDSLSTLDEKSYNSLTDKPTISTFYPSLQDTLNNRYRRSDTANVLLSRTRASHDYLARGDTTSVLLGQTRATSTYIPLIQRAANNGVATLDNGGKVPYSQLPAVLMIYKGIWDAHTNTPTLADNTGINGWVYVVSVGDTVNLGSGDIIFYAGDFCIHNGTNWERSVGTDNVVSVNNQQGVVSLTTDHVPDYINKRYVTDAEKTAITHSNRALLDVLQDSLTKAVMWPDTLTKIQTKYQSKDYLTTESDPKYIADSSGIAYLAQQNTYLRKQIINDGTAVEISGYKGANSDGYNLFIGGGGQSSIGEVGATYKGSYNTFNGYRAGFSNTTGYFNTFNGYQAGFSNTTGSYNTFNGMYAGYNNTTGYYNTFNGMYAGVSNTTGYYNTFNGMDAGFSNTTGYFNTFNGYQAGYSNTTGFSNTFNGYRAGVSNTTGSNNTFNGLQAGYYNVDGVNNLFSGFYSGIGAENTAEKSVSDTYMTLLGNYASKQNESVLTNGTAIGYNAKVLQSNQVVLGNDNVTTTLLKGSVGIGTTSPTAAYLTTPGSTTNSSIVAGALELQSHAVGTQTIGSNLYYNGTTYKYRATNAGISSMIQINANGLLWHTAPAGSAGATATLTQRFGVDASGNGTFGGAVTVGATAYTLPSSAGTAGQCLVMKTPVGDKVMEWFTAYNASDSTKFPWMYSGGKAIQRATKPVIISDSLRVNRTIESRDSISTWKGVKVYHSNIYLAYGASITFFPWAHGWGTISMFSPAEGEGGTFARFRFDQYGKITLLSDCTSDVILGDVDKYLDLIGQVGTSQIKIKNGMSDSNGHMIIEIVYAIDEAF